MLINLLDFLGVVLYSLVLGPIFVAGYRAIKSFIKICRFSWYSEMEIESEEKSLTPTLLANIIYRSNMDISFVEKKMDALKNKLSKMLEKRVESLFVLMLIVAIFHTSLILALMVMGIELSGIWVLEGAVWIGISTFLMIPIYIVEMISEAKLKKMMKDIDSSYVEVYELVRGK